MIKRIILAAGHGGGDSGAVGQGTTEAAECIQIVNRAAEKLRADGQVEVVVVPHELNLVDEIQWVNNRYKNLEDGYALEVHKNATVNAHGIEGWYYANDAQSASFMDTISRAVANASGLRYRGNFPDSQNRHGSLGWVRETNPWAGLLECGFVSDGGDPVDDNADERYAEGIKLGVLAMFGLQPKPAPVVQVPPQATVNFRVYDNTKQIGAYQLEDNAWAKYRDAGGVRIVDSNGADVTAYFVNKYRPVVPQPAPGADPHPELKEINGKLDVILELVRQILAKLTGVFK